MSQLYFHSLHTQKKIRLYKYFRNQPTFSKNIGKNSPNDLLLSIQRNKPACYSTISNYIVMLLLWLCSNSSTISTRPTVLHSCSASTPQWCNKLQSVYHRLNQIWTAPCPTANLNSTFCHNALPTTSHCPMLRINIYYVPRITDVIISLFNDMGSALCYHIYCIKSNSGIQAGLQNVTTACCQPVCAN